MNKDKIDIIQRFVSNTVENAKVINDDKTTIAEKVMAQHNQGMNVKGAIFQMQQLKFKNSNLKIGGVVHHCDDMKMVVEREVQPKILPRGETANSITINVDTVLTDDLHKKIYDAISI